MKFAAVERLHISFKVETTINIVSLLRCNLLGLFDYFA